MIRMNNVRDEEGNRIRNWECGMRNEKERKRKAMEFGLRPLRAVGSRYEPEAIGEGPTPRRELGMRNAEN
jgi:hypothetical protein